MWAAKLGHGAIHRLWQLLLKGLAEVHGAPMPLEAAEMAMLRVIHASELPDPGAVMERLASGEASRAAARRRGAEGRGAGALAQASGDLPRSGRGAGEGRQGPYRPAACTISSGSFPTRRPSWWSARQSRFRPISCAIWRGALKALTGTAWQVRASDEPAAPSLLDQEKAAAERLRQEVLEAPLVKAAFEAFPEAELAGFRLDEPRSA